MNSKQEIVSKLQQSALQMIEEQHIKDKLLYGFAAVRVTEQAVQRVDPRDIYIG